MQSISEDDIGGTLRKAAMAVISKTGGASGPLYGTFLMDAGKAAPDGHLTLSDWATMMRAGLEGVQKRGKAKTGEKTMVDALIPAVEALDEAVSGGSSWAEALVSAADAAEDGMHATTPLVATKGRASYLGEQRKGHQDPGETSTYHLFATALDAETNEGTGSFTEIANRSTSRHSARVQNPYFDVEPSNGSLRSLPGPMYSSPRDESDDSLSTPQLSLSSFPLSSPPHLPSPPVVGIVLVSHSRSLAQALVPLLREMSGDDIRIKIAAGAGDNEESFGTSAPDICGAIEDADDGDGVVVLLDMGSAVMNAEMALDFLDSDVAERTRLLSAPFVEGAVSASVAASGHASIDQVVENARAALHEKQEALPDHAQPKPADVSTKIASDEESPEPDATDAPEMTPVWDATADVEVVNHHGLHARPAAQFVRMALSHTRSQPEATVQISDLTNENGPVDATSQSTVTTLGAVRGHTLRIQATGPGAEAIVSDLADLVSSGFGETNNKSNKEKTGGASALTPNDSSTATGGSPSSDDAESDATQDASPEANAADSSTYPHDVQANGHHGISVQPGTALAEVHVHRPALPSVPEETTEDPSASWDKLSTILDAVSEKMEQERSRLQSQGHTDAADILGAQQLLLNDPALRNRAHANITEKHYDAPRAWMDAVDDVIQAYSSAEDTYLSQRADDVRDVAVRVLHVLVDVTPSAIEGPEADHVLITRRIRPSDVPTLDVTRVRAVVCAEGNATSHSAILLRGRGIPTIFDAGPDVLGLSEGTPIAVDAGEGLFWIDPDAKTRRHVGRVHNRQQTARKQAEASAHDPAVTTDGTPVNVSANISQISEAPTAEEYGADSVGLLRTEFLFSGRDEPPQESDQLDALLQVSTAMEKKQITVRALDTGGDKPISYLPLPDESNPFLGLRGIRVLLRHPDLFRRQIRAVLRLAVDVNVRLMLPMVCTVDEIRQAKAVLTDAQAELDERGLATTGRLPLGTMIETPASALSASAFAEEVDFFSIGTNDLAQYTMAADREHGGLGSLTDALHPPVLRLIQETAEAATTASIPVSVCGEVAGDDKAVPILLGLGITHLSVSPQHVPTVKSQVRSLDLGDCQRLAAECLRADDAEAVRALSQDMLDGLQNT